MRSRRSRNDQNRPKTAIFSKNPIFVEVGRPLYAYPGLITATAMAVAVIRPGYAYRGRPTSTKIGFLLKIAVLGLFWSFLDLLDLKNGSGSKFYAGK